MIVFAVICLAGGVEFSERSAMIMTLRRRSCTVVWVLGYCTLVLSVRVHEAASIEAAFRSSRLHIVSKWRGRFRDIQLTTSIGK